MLTLVFLKEITLLFEDKNMLFQLIIALCYRTNLLFTLFVHANFKIRGFDKTSLGNCFKLPSSKDCVINITLNIHLDGLLVIIMILL